MPIPTLVLRKHEDWETVICGTLTEHPQTPLMTRGERRMRGSANATGRRVPRSRPEMGEIEKRRRGREGVHEQRYPFTVQPCDHEVEIPAVEVVRQTVIYREATA